MPDLIFEIPLEVRAKASASWTWKHVEARLAHLKTLPPDEETDREIRYLQKLKLKR